MIVPLVLTGVILLAAGVIGGGLKASGIEIKVLTSRATQVGLALVGILAVLLGMFGNSLAPAAPQPAAAQTSSPTTTPSCCPRPTTTAVDTTTTTTPSTTTPSSAPAGTDRVFWSGTISLDTDAELDSSKLRDLDAKPPKLDKDEGDVGVGATSAGSEGFLNSPRGQASVALWTGKGEPSHQQCQETAVAAGSYEISLELGDFACVRTSEGRTARLELVAIPTHEFIQAATTVWDDAPAGP